MTPDDLIAAFNELGDVDAETRIDRTTLDDDETVRLFPSWNKGAVRRFKALAADAAALFDPAGPGDPVTRWLRFVLDHAPELVEDKQQGPGRSLGYAIEHHDDGTEGRVPFIAQTVPNAASASALVVRRCRPLTEKGELAEQGQGGVTDALARADVDTSTLPVDPHDGNGGGHAEPTATDLTSEVGISVDTFRRVRNAAGIVVIEKGAKRGRGAIRLLKSIA